MLQGLELGQGLAELPADLQVVARDPDAAVHGSHGLSANRQGSGVASPCDGGADLRSRPHEAVRRDNDIQGQVTSPGPVHQPHVAPNDPCGLGGQQKQNVCPLLAAGMDEQGVRRFGPAHHGGVARQPPGAVANGCRC